MRRKARKKTKYTIGEVWSDIDHRFVKDGIGGLKRAVNIEAVFTSIDNILKTSKGERVMLTEFGSEIHGLMFERLNSTSVSFITRILKDTIGAWDDRVTTDEISISRDPDNNSVGIAMRVMIRGYEDIFKYEMNIKGTI